MAHELLLDPRRELEQFGLSYEFVRQFEPRAVEVQVVVGGALGVAEFAWRFQGDANYGTQRRSAAGVAWSTRLSDVFADATFPAGAYAEGDSYLISEPLDDVGACTVTRTGTSPAGVTATRFDIRLSVGQQITDEAIGRMGPAVVPPIIAWGADIKGAVGAIMAYELKSITGLAPVNAAIGDENLLVRAKQARDWLDAVGRGDITPADPFEDSSGDAASSSIVLAAESDDPRGW